MCADGISTTKYDLTIGSSQQHASQIHVAEERRKSISVTYKYPVKRKFSNWKLKLPLFRFESLIPVKINFFDEKFQIRFATIAVRHWWSAEPTIVPGFSRWVLVVEFLLSWHHRWLLYGCYVEEAASDENAVQVDLMISYIRLPSVIIVKIRHCWSWRWLAFLGPRAGQKIDLHRKCFSHLGCWSRFSACFL